VLHSFSFYWSRVGIYLAGRLELLLASEEAGGFCEQALKPEFAFVPEGAESHHTPHSTIHTHAHYPLSLLSQPICSTLPTGRMTPADIEAQLRALIKEALEEEKNRMDDDEDDNDHNHDNTTNGNKSSSSSSSSTTQASSVRRLATALHKAEAHLRTTILQQQQQQQQQQHQPQPPTISSTSTNQDNNDEADAEETQAKLLAALHRALLPYQTSLRHALSSIYHADSLLSLSLKHAQSQLASSSHAQQRPINILEALRLAHRFRVVSSAPPGWEGGGREGGMFDFLPPHPYMPGNECLVASLLRKEHVENEKEAGKRKKRMREAEAGGKEGGREGGREAETMELIRQLSESGSLGGPPPGWQPGQSLAVDVEVLQKLKEQQQQQQQQQQLLERQKEKAKEPGLGKTGGAAAGGGGGGGGGGGRAAPARPKKQTFMDSSSDEEEGDEEEEEEGED